MYQPHEIANIWPTMSDDDYHRLKASVAEEGLLEPIWLYEDQVLDGRHRQRACVDLNIVPDYRTYDGHDPLGFAFALNSARRHLTTEQKAALAVSMKEYEAKRLHKNKAQGGRGGIEHEENFPHVDRLPQSRDIAGDRVGVSGKSVDAAERVQKNAPEVFERMKEGKFGSVSRAERVSQMEPETRLKVIEDIDAGTPAKEAEAKHVHVSANSGNNEWYTPSEYIEAARDVMGEIDLDPASCDTAQRRVNAGTYYTADDDGLSHPWSGRVWMNPPYAKGLVDEFAEKLSSHVKEGDVQQAVVLVNNATDTRWFAKLVSQASAICFPTGRVKFHRPDGSTGAPLQGQAIVYFGDSVSAFINAFSQFGHTWGAA